MSNQISKDLAKIILDTHNWNNRTNIEEFETWELREALSYVMDLNLFLGDNEIDLYKKKVQKILAGDETVEIENYILTQAFLQQLLRQHGVEIKCFELNKFPLLSKDLIPLLDKSKTSWLKSMYYKAERWSRNYTVVAMVVVIVLYNIFFFDPALLTTGFIVAYILHHLLQVIEHEWWNHEYIVPKNKYIEKFFKFIIYFSLGNIEVQRASHIHHHYYWNTEKDYLNTIILSNKYGHLFRTASDAVTADYTLYQRVVEKGHKKLEKENKFSKFASKNQKLLLTLLCLLVLILFGLPVMINICFIAIVWHRVWGAMPDVAFYIANKRDNFPFMYPLMLRDAYHYDHHIKWLPKEFKSIDDLFSKQGWLKYLSFEYYFIKTFFNFNKIK